MVGAPGATRTRDLQIRFQHAISSTTRMKRACWLDHVIAF